MNGFNYVEGNPVNGIDPSGQGVAWPCMWPNHPEEVRYWSEEGHREIVEVRCVGPKGLPPMFGSADTMSTGNPTSDAAKMIVVYGLYCISLLAQEIANTWPQQGSRALVVAKPFEAPLPTPEPEDWFPEFESVTAYRGLDGDPASDKTFFKRPLYNPGQFKLRPQDKDGLSIFELPYIPNNKPYAVGFDLLVPVPIVPGSTGSVLGLSSCLATYRPDIDPGHWSLNCLPYEQETISKYARSRGAILNPNWAGQPSDRRLPMPDAN
jgi:hypothetical protein